MKAIVVLQEGATTADELIEHVRNHIASYKNRARSSSWTSCAGRFAVDYDTLDARFGGGGYPVPV